LRALPTDRVAAGVEALDEGLGDVDSGRSLFVGGMYEGFPGTVGTEEHLSVDEELGQEPAATRDVARRGGADGVHHDGNGDRSRCQEPADIVLIDVAAPRPVAWRALAQAHAVDPDDVARVGGNEEARGRPAAHEACRNLDGPAKTYTGIEFVTPKGGMPNPM
jgi:hypothetical protein